jgi:hypothetical protein
MQGLPGALHFDAIGCSAMITDCMARQDFRRLLAEHVVHHMGALSQQRLPLQ